MTYAQFLADKGFNLILIDRDIQPLNDIELKIKDKFSKRASTSHNPAPHMP
jgi:short-subunit dehydrogenase